MFRKMYNLVRIQFFQEIHEVRVWAGYAFGFWMGLSIGVRYVSFSSGFPVGIFDPFILLTNQTFTVTLLMIGFLILVADAPFIHAGTYYILIRSGGAVWRYSMIIYIFLQLMLYEVLVMAGSVFPCFFYGNLSSCTVWSETIQILAGAVPGIALEQYHLPMISMRVLQSFLVLSAVMNSLLLNMCYFGLLGMVMFLGNLNTRLPVGSLLAVGIHLTGMLVMSDFVPLFKPSLVAHAMLQYHIPRYGPLSIVESYLLFGVSILCVFGVLYVLFRHIDYNTAVSQKTW